MAAVREIWRYPVKSMAGERVEGCLITDHGLDGDRRWGLIDGTAPRVGKFFNLKQNANLMTYHARLVGDDLEVTAPDRTTVALQTALDDVLTGTDRVVTIRELPGANFDDSPVHIVNLASVELFGREAGRRLDPRRFRANLYVEGLAPEEEVSWLGRNVRAGDAELEVVSRCVRCAVITRDPDTTEAAPELLELLVDRHEKCMGVYCRVVRPGRVAIGDSVGPI